MCYQQFGGSSRAPRWEDHIPMEVDQINLAQQPKRCLKCHKSGHIQRDCRNEKKKTAGKVVRRERDVFARSTLQDDFQI